MHKIGMVSFALSLFIVACGGGGSSTSGSGGAGGSGTGGEAGAPSTSSSSSSASSSSGSTVTTYTLTPGDTCVADTSVGPITPGDALESDMGATFDERSGVWAGRCYPHPSPGKPFVVDSVSYTIGTGKNCKALAHKVVIFGLPALPVGPTHADADASADVPAGAFGDLTTPITATVSDPYVCAAVVIGAESDDVRACIGLCGGEDEETPDADVWSADDAVTGLPLCNDDLSACDVVQLVESPTPPLGAGFKPYRVAITIAGHVD